ncbi:MAG: porin [Xanthomonadaceae bacterium]|nr:porin [Xanthomonadaceae bacterium]
MPKIALAETSTNGLSWGGFVDTYYAYDFNLNSDRSFTTQPARHNEFNINLAFVEAKLDQDRLHGRLAIQFGTSVQNNYAAEPALYRNIQEAFVGYKLGEQTWIDAGIMLSHIGLENFISKDNILYTRSLVADYSPYFETGIRLSTQWSDKWSTQLLVLNGWQNIAENNSNKAIGTQVSYSPTTSLTFIYSTFFGKEYAYRYFNDLMMKLSLDENWTIAAQADLGLQDESTGGSNANWSGFSLMVRHQLSSTLALNLRCERFSDPKQVLIPLSNGNAFKAWVGSLGVDVKLSQAVSWRNETKFLYSEDPIFPSAFGFRTLNTTIVTALTAGF